MPEPEPDFITIIPASIALKWNVVVMRYRAADDGYYVWKVSALLTYSSAQEVARLWADERHVEIR